MNDYFDTTIMSGINLRNRIAGADIEQMTHPSHEDMYGANRSAGEEIRALLLKHGIVPEDVPPEPHISEAQRIANGQIPLGMIPPKSLPDPDDDKEEE